MEIKWIKYIDSKINCCNITLIKISKKRWISEMRSWKTPNYSMKSEHLISMNYAIKLELHILLKEKIFLDLLIYLNRVLTLLINTTMNLWMILKWRLLEGMLLTILEWHSFGNLSNRYQLVRNKTSLQILKRLSTCFWKRQLIWNKVSDLLKK